MKISYVAQEDEYGCAIASIAMIVGWGYDAVKAHFVCDFQKAGQKHEMSRAFICEHGFSAIEKIGQGYTDVRAHNKRMLEPFAPVHLLSIVQFADAKTNHAVVMDNKRRIYDPGNKDVKTADHYYEIVRVTGFWPDYQKLKHSKRGR